MRFETRYIPPILRLMLVGLTMVLGRAAHAEDYTVIAPKKPGVQTVENNALPLSCQFDFHATLDSPAGRHGFLEVGKDGHFHWADGTRARFWGVNISSTRLDIPDAQIDAVVNNLAQAGINMVRLEAIDNHNCLLGKTDAPDSQTFDPHYLDRLDRWMDVLRRHGIYYYLDLLDFRTFKIGDKVLNADSFDRGARPYAIFDDYLIQLQQDYAQKLLTHRNPYSNLRPVDDPALALVELCNEHGVFLYPEKLEKLVEPYNNNLHVLWNRWLHDRYGTTQNIAAAWATPEIPNPLRQDEDVIQNTVDLPMLATPPDAAGRAAVAPRRTPARLRDGVEFLTLLQRNYFRQMRQFLRQIGLKVPVTAVVSAGIVPDVASVAQECDFTAENWYGESDGLDANHPSVRFFGDRNPLRDDSPWGFAPVAAGLHWNNKPVVIREWGTSWPNQDRAASVPQGLAYAALQDIDAMLLFGYQTNTDSDGSTPDRLNDLAFQCDPTVWGLYALAGQAFLHGAIHPAVNTVTLVYPQARLDTWPNHITDAYRLAWSVRINNVTAEKPTGDLSFIPQGNGQDLQPVREILDRLSKDSVTLNTKFSTGLWRSDTGEITLYSHEGRMEIESPTFCALAGELDPNKVYDLGVFRLSTPTRFGALVAYAVDGKPLADSKHILVKMVSRAQNTGEVMEKAPPGSPDTWVLRKQGAAPVVTFGRPSTQPTRLWFLPGDPDTASNSAMTPVLTLGMVDGSWELEIKDGHASLTCDTPAIQGAFGMAFHVGAKPKALQ